MWLYLPHPWILLALKILSLPWPTQKQPHYSLSHLISTTTDLSLTPQLQYAHLTFSMVPNNHFHQHPIDKPTYFPHFYKIITHHTPNLNPQNWARDFWGNWYVIVVISSKQVFAYYITVIRHLEVPGRLIRHCFGGYHGEGCKS